MDIQKTAFDGTRFQCELILSRIYLCILEFLQTIKGNKDEKNIFMHILAISYFKGKVEFFKKYPMKNIDWTSRETKVRHVVPSWRQSDSDPAPPTHSHLAQAIMFRIDNGFESLEGTAVKVELKEAIENKNSMYVPPKNHNRLNNSHQRNGSYSNNNNNNRGRSNHSRGNSTHYRNNTNQNRITTHPFKGHTSQGNGNNQRNNHTRGSTNNKRRNGNTNRRGSFRQNSQINHSQIQQNHSNSSNSQSQNSKTNDCLNFGELA